MTFIAICDSFSGGFEEALEYAERIGVFSAFGDSERKRISSIAQRSSKELSLRALIALKVLCDKAGLQQDKLTIKRNENGKPLFVCGEHYFSLSHSGDLAVAALSRTEIGIDIERIAERQSLPKLADRFFCVSEREYYEKSGGTPDAFYRVWTAKEALVKRRGETLSQLSSSMDTLTLEESGDEHFHRLKVELRKEDYFMTVSLGGDDELDISFINCEPNVKAE